MEKRCFNCMEPLGDEKICPKCGFENNLPENSATIKAGTLLKGRYYIGNIFSKSLDSVVYIAYDEELNKKVFVREFCGEKIAKFTHKITATELSQKFLSYSKTTATIGVNDILPRTVDTFAENSIGYLVTDYFEGESLKTLINSGIKISEGNALKIAEKLLKGLKAVHNSGIVYGAISPETLYILKNGDVKLFGIGCSFYDFITDLDYRVEVLNPSYAAPELFDDEAKAFPASDVYSVAAILYRLLTGSIPAISFLRSGGENLASPHKINKSIPKNINTALLNALNWQLEKRTETETAFLDELSAKKVKRRRSGIIIWANILGFFQGIYDKLASKTNKKAKDKKSAKASADGEAKEKIGLLWLWITIPAVILVGLIVFLVIMFLPTPQNSNNTSSNATSSEIWYYGSGVETPTNNSRYDFGGYSSKAPSSSKPNNTGNTQSIDPNSVECPDLAGYTLLQAKAILNDNNLLLGEVYYDYSNDYPVDYVMAQSLKSGGMVQKGSKIDVVVCKGPKAPEVELPDVTGMEMRLAAEKLMSEGFSNIEYSFFLSDDAPGTVTDASFKDNSGTGYDSTVVITVSGEEIEVPDYSGKTVAEAKAISSDISFVFKSENGNEISSITDAGASAFIVVSQDVPKGVAYKGITITLTVK